MLKGTFYHHLDALPINIDKDVIDKAEKAI